MNVDPDLAEVLTQLAEGRFSADEWLEWWRQNGERIAALLKRTQWLRLKPPTPGSWGPPCRSAWASQTQACTLLSEWGVAFTASDRYKLEWDAYFAEYSREQAIKRKERQKQFTATIKAIATDFPKFAAYLKRRKADLECLGAGVLEDELNDWETKHTVELPAAYKLFLRSCKELVIGDDLKIGLRYTFVSEGTQLIPKSSICIGDWFLEADGDQLYVFPADQGHAVFYYSHSEPELRKVAASFFEWAETFPNCGKTKRTR